MPITYTYTSCTKRRRLSPSPLPQASSSPPSSLPSKRHRGDASSPLVPTSENISPPTSPHAHHDEHTPEATDPRPDKQITNPLLNPASTTAPPPPTRTPLTPLLHHTTQPLKSKHPRRKLTQTTLSLTPSLLSTSSSSGPFTTCLHCGMHYNKTQPSDRALHTSYCADAALLLSEARAGIMLTADALDHGVPGVRKLLHPRGKQSSRDGAGATFEITPAHLPHHALSLRRTIARAITLVERELGSVLTPSATLFARESGFVVYLYVVDTFFPDGEDCGRRRGRIMAQKSKKRKGAKRGDKVAVGVMLAETITPSRLVSPSRPSATPTSNNHDDADADADALLGITRIWTAPTHRHRGVASALLDAAADSWGAAHEAPPRQKRNAKKEMVAFSAPTAAGAGLAAGWVGSSSASSFDDGTRVCEGKGNGGLGMGEGIREEQPGYLVYV